MHHHQETSKGIGITPNGRNLGGGREMVPSSIDLAKPHLLNTEFFLLIFSSYFRPVIYKQSCQVAHVTNFLARFIKSYSFR